MDNNSGGTTLAIPGTLANSNFVSIGSGSNPNAPTTVTAAALANPAASTSAAAEPSSQRCW